MSLVNLVIAILAINFATFALYVYDKELAKQGNRRISENSLHLCALAGGSAGALIACYMVRHKTRKPSFLMPLWLILIGQVGLLLYVAIFGLPQFIIELFPLAA